MPNDARTVYLNDHLAGARAGHELAQRIATEYEGTEMATVVGHLADEIGEDVTTLQRLMEALGVEISGLRQTLARVSEKASAVELRPRDDNLALGGLLEAEVLSIGISGKRALWEALQAAIPDEPTLAPFDLRRLIDRATEQLERLEEVRRGLAKEALGAK